ncbi:MAG: PTS sugar transporter subunit IIA [Spirochaetota bacterium]
MPTSDEVLTLSETAAYLKLGERTIHRMIQRSEIPCARVGGQWRFLKSVLDDWLLSRMQVLPRNELASFLDATHGVVQLVPMIDRSTVVDPITPGEPRHVLARLASPLADRGLVPDLGAYVKLLLARETLSSTAIGHGVAVPHVRRPSENPEDAPAVILGICRDGTDFNAPDGEPVHIFFLLGTTSEAVHLRLLKRITLLFRDRSTIESLLSCESHEEALDELARREAQLPRGG